MPLLDTRTTRAVVTILIIAGLLGFLWAARMALILFLLAIFFAYLIAPVVDIVCRWLRQRRSAAIGVVYLVIFALLTTLVLFVGPGLVQNARRLAEISPSLYQKVATGQIAWQLGAEHGWSFATRIRIQRLLAAHSKDMDVLTEEFAARLARLGSHAWWLIIIPILAIFFLKDGERFRQAALEFFERRSQREFVEAVMTDVHLVLAQYIRAQTILAIFAMIVYIGGLDLMKVPYGTILGVIGGCLEFIPIIGPLLTALLIMGVALGGEYPHLIALIVFLGVWRTTQDYVVAPRIMGRQLELHPLAIIFGVLAGAELAGIFGVYLSIPAVAVLRVVWRRWQAYSNQAIVRPPEISQ